MEPTTDRFAIYYELSAAYPRHTPEEALPDILRCGYCGTRLFTEAEWSYGFCCDEHGQGQPRAWPE